MPVANSLPLKIRPATEIWAALIWFGAFCVSLYFYLYSAMPKIPFLWFSLVALLFTVWRGYYGVGNLIYRSRLVGRPLRFITPKYLLEKVESHQSKLWLGWGYDWKQTHAQEVYEIEKREESFWLPNSLVIRFFAMFGMNNPPPPSEISDRPLGKLWMQGLEKEKDVFIPIKDLEGHTLVVGTTGSGKTRLYENLVFGAIHRGECVIVVDPKGDQELRERIQKECERSGRGDSFAYFHPAHPNSSVRIDPLMNWNRSTEIASRIAALMGSETDAFTAFSWRALDTIASALVMVNKRPNIASIKHAIEAGPNDLLQESLEIYFNEIGIEWEEKVRDYEIKAKRGEFKKPEKTTPKELVARVQFYKIDLSEKFPNSSIDNLVTMYEWNRDHFGKMVGGLLPILTQLTSGELGGLISPRADDENDIRPILDSAKIINQNMVLYLGTDSLADNKVSSSIGSIFLADLTAVAADRYNFGVDESVKISLFVDESAEVVSPEFLQLANKSRGAGFKITFATQTIADFEARMGSSAEAMQLIANANNVISLRIKDEKTLEFVSDKFGEAVVTTAQVTQTTTPMSSDRDVTNYSGGYGERTTETLSPLVSADLLSSLPNLEYFASLSAGRIIKGRLPLFEKEDMPSYKEQFWLERDV